MNIQLKNVRVNERLSRESLAFSATLYINGQRVGILTNDGHGGETNYRALDKRGESLIREAVKWVGSFPRKLGAGNANGKTTAEDPSKFRHHLDDMVTGWWNGREAVKFRRKAEKAMENGIVFGVPGRSYRVMRYRQPIAVMIRLDKGVERLRLDIHGKVLPLLQEGEKILNTNIPGKIIQLLDIPAGKWVDQRDWK
jgi:hypothetical protein